MDTFKLKLREAISQFGDTTLGYVLDWVDMDTNFINLKGNDVDSIALHGNILTITKINGVALTCELPVNISQTINSGVIAKSPSENAVFNALSFKIDCNEVITGGTKTKITYDEKGLVVAGEMATTVDVPDSINKRYVTDSNLNDLNNLSVVAITNNYNDLNNLPILSYIYNQTIPADIWEINHPLKKNPSVTVVNNLGLTVEGQVSYETINSLKVSFTSAFAGVAFLN